MANRILIVEDNESLREMFREMLSHRGFEVCVAATCAGACALAVDEMFDAVLADLDLPDGSGLDLCRRLEARCTAFGRSLHLWLMTGSHDPELAHEAIAAGACGIFHKPFSVHAASSAIERILRVRGSVPSAAVVGCAE